MKKIIITSAAILLLAAACQKTQPIKTGENPPATSTSGQTASWNTYISPDQYGFSLQYPYEFGVSTSVDQTSGLSYIPLCGDGMNTVACFYLVKGDYPGTNFDGAGVTVGIYPKLTNDSQCYDFTVSTNAAQKAGPDFTINGVVFKTATGGDAGAGHFNDVKVYRNFHNSQCYEITEHVGSSAYANYAPGTIKEFTQDMQNEVWQKLEGVVDTLKFTR